MQKVSYGVREVLLGEITKTSKSSCGEGGVLGDSSRCFENRRAYSEAMTTSRTIKKSL